MRKQTPPTLVASASMPRVKRAFALAIIGLALPVPSQAACQIESVDMPVKMVGSRAIATIGINGTPVPMTVDSGASYSMLTEAAAAQLNLVARLDPRVRVQGLTGSIAVRTTTVEKLQLLRGDIGRTQFIVGGVEPGAGTMGLLGRNILSLADTEYDLAHGVIRFQFPGDGCAKANMAYWAGSAPVTEVEMESDYRAKVPAIRAEVKLNGNTLIALFDSGAGTVVKSRVARNAGVGESDWKPSGTMHGVGAKTTSVWTARFDKFEIGGETVVNNRLSIADFSLDDAGMLLGIDFFLSHRIYVSKKQSKLFITYNGGPVFALDRSETARGPDTSSPTADAQPATADELARRGAASAARHDYDGALADLDKACALEPTSAALFAQRGSIQQALKRPAKALEDFDKALELDPAQADAHLQRAVLRINGKERDGAMADLDALDKMLAPQAQMRFTMAELYLNLEQPAQALIELNLWLPTHSKEATRAAALNRRCWARVLLGVELDQAIDDCDDAVSSDSKNVGYLTIRGWAYLRSGKYKKAVSDFDRSIELHAVNAFALYGRGVAKTRLGNEAEGEVDFAAAKKAQATIEARVTQMGLTTEASAKP